MASQTTKNKSSIDFIKRLTEDLLKRKIITKVKKHSRSRSSAG